jgi:hypothetical protein
VFKYIQLASYFFSDVKELASNILSKWMLLVKGAACCVYEPSVV